jgi:hypothetical protein
MYMLIIMGVNIFLTKTSQLDERVDNVILRLQVGAGVPEALGAGSQNVFPCSLAYFQGS